LWVLLLPLPTLLFVIAGEVALVLALADFVASSQSGFVEFRIAVARSKMFIS